MKVNTTTLTSAEQRHATARARANARTARTSERRSARAPSTRHNLSTQPRYWQTSTLKESPNDNAPIHQRWNR